MSAGAQLAAGWSWAAVAHESLQPQSPLQEASPGNFCFPLTFPAGYSHQVLQWSGGRLRKTEVKASLLSWALSEAAWEPAKGGTSVIWNLSIAKIEIFSFPWKKFLCQKMKVLRVNHNIRFLLVAWNKLLWNERLIDIFGIATFLFDKTIHIKVLVFNLF